MYSHKVLLLILVTIVIAGCQTKPVKYEVDTVVRPMLMADGQGRPRQYTVDITITETNPNGESIVTRPQILTMVGKQAEIISEELHPNQPPGRISCTALINDKEDGHRVDTSVLIIKKGKEVCSIKQSTTFPQ
jgi:hypothetical protein